MAIPGCEVARRDRLIAVSGQADFDSFAQAPHPADPRAQVVAVVSRIRERLERVGANLSDLTKPVVFHVPGSGCGEREMRALLARALGPDVLTTLTMVPLLRLVLPGLLIAVDAYAMRGADGRRIERAPIEVPGLASLPEPFCHGLRCEQFIFTSGQSALDERGEVLFAGDLPSQNRDALDGVAAILDGLGAGPGDIVKFNTWRAPPPSPQAYRRAAQNRAMSRLSALKMIKRRAQRAGLPAEICAHSFGGTGITEYLRNGGDLEVAARIAGHESSRTTLLYNRLPEEISLDEIERIHI